MKKIYRNKIRRKINELFQKIEYKIGKTKLISIPTFAQIEATNKCNLNCDICPRKIQNREYGELTFKNFLKIIENFPTLQRITLQGWGEPYLCKDLDKILDYCKTKGINTSFATNGILPLKVLPDDLTISIYPSNINQIKKILSTSNIKINFDLTLSKTTSNKEFLSEVVSITKGNKLYVHNYTPYISKELELDKEEEKNILSYLKSLNNKIIFTGHYSKKNYFKEEEIGICKVAWFETFISWNGDVYPCCHFFDFSFGNVIEQKFLSIWNSEKYIKFRERMLKNPFSFCVDICKEGLR